MASSFKDWFKARRRQFQRRLLPVLGYWPLRLLCSTLRLRVTDPSGQQAAWQIAGGPPQVLVFWHDQLFAMPWVYQTLRMRQPAAVMISRNISGEVIAGIAARFGLGAARGSPSRGGREACRELVQVLEAGGLAGITPDGSRGPRHVLKPGVFVLARAGKAQVVPMRVTYGWRVCLPTWDKFQIPLPFSAIHVEVATPVAWNDPALEEKVKAALAG